MEKLELRINANNLAINEDELIVEGLVNKTDSWSSLLGMARKFREKVEKGVFDRAIRNASRIDFLSEHQPNLLLSTTENDTLQLWEDDEGLKMRAKIVPTSYGQDLFTLMKNKMVNHMSFGFKVVSDSWTKLEDGTFERRITDLILKEVSVVRNPAYPQSAIAARGIDVIEDVEIPTEIDAVEEIVEERTEEPVATETTPVITMESFLESLNQFKADIVAEIAKSVPQQAANQDAVLEVVPVAIPDAAPQPVAETVVEATNVNNETTPQIKPEVIKSADNTQGVADLLTKYKELQKLKIGGV